MAAALPWLAAAGTALSAAGQWKAGEHAKDASKFESDQAKRRANDVEAASQRESAELARQGRLRQSRALAVAAASGGGAADPTVMNLMANIAGDTQYEQMSALYAGETRSDYLETEADVTQWKGQQARDAGRLGAISTVLSDSASLYAKYGGKK